MSLDESKPKMTDAEVLKRYAEVCSAIKRLETEKEELKESVSIVIERINPDDDNKVDTDFGTFSNVTKRKYKYTPFVESLKNELDLAKEKEEQEGTAEYTETKYVKFTTN